MTQPCLNQVQVQGGSRFSCNSTERVLIAMERSGARCIPVGCRNGGCGICKIRVLSGDYTTGKMSAAHITEAEAKNHYALACQIYPLSDLVVETARSPGHNQSSK